MTEENDVPASTRFEDAVLAAALFAIAPHELGGIRLHSLPGPVRDEWLALLSDMLPADVMVRRVPLNVTPGRLLGGLDLAATLEAGRPVAERGLLGELDGHVALCAMAERMQTETAAHLAQALDRGEVQVARDGVSEICPARFGVVALDEGIDADEQPPSALLDRLAFMIDLDGIPVSEVGVSAPTREEVRDVREVMYRVTINDEMMQVLAEVSLGLGVMSLRPMLLAVTAARLHAALEGRTEVARDDAIQAARLVLAPRATIVPQAPQAEEEQPPEPQEPQEPEELEDNPDNGDEDIPPPTQEEIDRALEDVVLEAAQAAIPPNLLAKMKAGAMMRQRGGAQGKSGALKVGTKRGRPAGVRSGDPSRGERINVIETLRAAAPWQRLRRADTNSTRVEVRREDFRVTRTKERAETTTIFVVDASGSQALNRLAEVKGAVELLLNECYVRRDQVALIAFRGRAADVILPPTRSLVRAKRSLAGLPGGGGTPLALGIDQARALAEGCARRGQTPVIVFLTDGRANVSRRGEGGREAAEADALDAAQLLRIDGRLAVIVDTSPRPQADGRDLAAQMEALYLPLPRANSETLSDAVGAVTAGRR